MKVLHLIVCSLEIRALIMSKILIIFVLLASNLSYAKGGYKSDQEKQHQEMAFCVAEKNNRCFDLVCLNSEEINCKQNCEQLAKQACQSSEATKRYNHKMCIASVANHCINSICPTSEDINCQEKCNAKASLQCD